MLKKLKSFFFVFQTKRALKKLRKRKKRQEKRFKLLNDLYREEQSMIATLGRTHALMRSVEDELAEQGILPKKD